MTITPARYVFASHDGFGLGHARRNTLIARAILGRDPNSEITIVTGLPMRPSWLGDVRLRVRVVPALLKDGAGGYRNDELPFDEAIAERGRAFAAAVAEARPHVVVVDRHPYGIAGELRTGLDLAARSGAALLLGLRDVLDEPAAVRAELAGEGWSDVATRFDEVLVYGERVVCDHEVEYGLPRTPRYCGWVTERAPAQARERELVVVTAGGGGDGDAVFELGMALAESGRRRIMLLAGPYAARELLDRVRRQPQHHPGVTIMQDAPSCASVLARAGAVVQMAGYNSTAEALAAGLRPVLLPRRSPRREQAIRAARFAALGLADVVDEGAPAAEVAWLLDRDRELPDGALAGAGIRLDGASRAAQMITRLATGVRA